jgi:hypothetical protein
LTMLDVLIPSSVRGNASDLTVHAETTAQGSGV